ncbi:cilia- and flagella-associated protein 45-like [Lineus longissimus]|uniref:cilia- and flagella-associated protein 45-like n=1 Tax=Lineus longissimus TaxID=88925 RepID=UPI00315CB50B
MEFKVWVDGIKRVVCGVTEETTCQDIILALAHATGQTGRFTLLEKWRNNERFLLPQDNPLRILHKWGEYATDVHFILRKSGKSRSSGDRHKEKFKHNFMPPAAVGNIKKSLTFSGAHNTNSQHLGRHSAQSSISSTDSYDLRASTHVPSQGSIDRRRVREKSPDSRRPQASVPPFTSQNKAPSTLHVDTKQSPPSYNSLERAGRTLSPVGGIRSPGSGSSVPSPPGTFENRKSKSKLPQSGQGDLMEELNLDINSVTLISEGEEFDRKAFEKKILEHGSLQDLVKLVELQKERVQLLDSQMHIMDSEIQFWEQKDKELTEQTRLLREQLEKAETAESKYEVEIKEIDKIHWADKIETEKKIEHSLKSEISLLKTRLEESEADVVQCEKDALYLEKEIAVEEAEIKEMECERQKQEAETLNKITVLQKDLVERNSENEKMQTSFEAVEVEVNEKENVLREKKGQIEELEKQIKLLNLDMFRKTPVEGMAVVEENVDDKSGRKSPRPPGRKLANFQIKQLTEGVITPKNPHGMWV